MLIRVGLRDVYQSIVLYVWFMNKLPLDPNTAWASLRMNASDANRSFVREYLLERIENPDLDKEIEMIGDPAQIREFLGKDTYPMLAVPENIVFNILNALTKDDIELTISLNELIGFVFK